MRTYVYIDGFNLYYGAVKGTPHKWLDPISLVRKLIRPDHDIVCVKYFTARISALPGNPDAPKRQEAYIRALRSMPGVEVIYGHFLTNRARRPKADGSGTVEILKTEEKGSDVNLATHLVADAFRGFFDSAIVISNDSDLCEPVRIVADEVGLKVGVLFPTATRDRRPSRELGRVATFSKPIRAGVVAACQLPDVVKLNGQEVRRPDAWK